MHATSKEATRREAGDHAATLAGAHNSPRGDGRAGLAPALAVLVPAVDGALLLGTLFGEGPEVAGEPLPWLHRRPYSPRRSCQKQLPSEHHALLDAVGLNLCRALAAGLSSLRQVPAGRYWARGCE